MGTIHDLSPHRPQISETQLREQFVSLAGSAFDFMISARALFAQKSEPKPAFEPALKATEAARRLSISASTFRDRVRNGGYADAVIRYSGPAQDGRVPLRFRADVISAYASRTQPTH